MKSPYLVPGDAPDIEAFAMVRPLRLAIALGRWLFLLTILFAIALTFVPWQQTAFGSGQVMAYSPTERQQHIDAPVDGWLEEWFVGEGSHVKRDDPIVRLVDNDPNLLDRIRAERAAVEARVAAAEQALNVARRNVQRQRELSQEGLSARKQYEEALLKEADVLKEVTAARAELARAQTRLARQDAQLVRAPRDGVIVRREAGQGTSFVKAGEPLALIVPETQSRAVELWVDGNDIPLVAAGDPVRLQFEGWPAVQFSGWPSVAVGTFAGRVDLVDAANIGANPGKFRVLVVPAAGAEWPSSRHLRQGVRAHGWVLLNEVALGYELWRRMNDFPATRSDEASSEKTSGEKQKKPSPSRAPSEDSGDSK